MELTKDFIKEIKEAKSIGEILEIAKKDNVRLSFDEASIMFHHKDMLKKLSKEEIEKTFSYR